MEISALSRPPGAGTSPQLPGTGSDTWPALPHLFCPGLQSKSFTVRWNGRPWTY